jgi:broad specificity phosphatase PhoE
VSDGARRIVLVRHPETVANAESRYIGRLDSPLSPRGGRQSAWLARSLENWGADSVFSSPLGRALLTAQAIAPAGVPVSVLGGLSEIDFGIAEGLTYDEIQARGIRLDYTGDGPVAPGGETGLAFDRRVREAADIIAAGPQRSVVVSHGGVIRRLLVAWLGLSADRGWSFAAPNAVMMTVRVNGGVGVLESLTPPPDLGEDRA